MDYPEGTCEVYGFFAVGHRRHYCYNAARCEVEINGEPYLSCFECRDELVRVGAIEKCPTSTQLDRLVRQ